MSEQKKTTKLEAAAALTALRGFIGPAQLAAVASACRGEERQFFYDKLAELAQTVSAMPKTYEQDGKGEQAIAYLHYFAGGEGNWWITEKDSEAPQFQAFGLADLGYGPELGYISIVELLECGAELDFYFKPRTLAEIKAKQAA